MLLRYIFIVILIQCIPTVELHPLPINFVWSAITGAYRIATNNLNYYAKERKDIEDAYKKVVLYIKTIFNDQAIVYNIVKEAKNVMEVLGDIFVASVTKFTETLPEIGNFLTLFSMKFLKCLNFVICISKSR